MKRTRSITTRLSVVFLLLALLVVLLGVFSIGTLTYFNRVSSQVRDRWLPGTSSLGDMNNLTSDFRAAEAATLLSTNAAERATHEKEILDLQSGIRTAQRSYSLLQHDAVEEQLYAQFARDWDQYRSVVNTIRDLTDAGDKDGAIAIYNTRSKSAYDAASDTLGLLTNRNVASAREASLREDNAYARLRWLILLTMLLAGLFVAAAMVYVRQSISAPLRDLAQRMLRLAANETGSEIAGAMRHDEIGEMARAVAVFRDNAVELIASRHGLEQQALMLQEKLAEEQRLMQRQRNFVSMASHEFRTPLAIIDAHAQRLIAMQERLRPAEIAERARKVRNAVTRMTHLIRNLIDTARVIDGDMDLYFHPTNTDLAQLLREVCQLQREITPQAQLLEQLEDALPPLYADANLLFQVCSNLVSNAVKYSPAGSLIKVIARADGAHLVICVEDPGIGIAGEDLTRVFERYFRGANSAGIVGTGVGLYFVKMVVDLHEGEVTAESRQDRGSRFTVRLPLRPAARTHQPPESG